jgi:flavoprotein
VIVAPATVNTINKWAAGICDTLALGILVEGTRSDATRSARSTWAAAYHR